MLPPTLNALSGERLAIVFDAGLLASPRSPRTPRMVLSRNAQERSACASNVFICMHPFTRVGERPALLRHSTGG